MNQRDHILSHLRSSDPKTGKYLSLSPMEALGLYRIYRLAARIDELRDEGHPITSELKKDRTGKVYAKYTYDFEATGQRKRVRSA